MTITVKLKDASRYIDEIAQSQMPYGCAMALTEVSKKIGSDLAVMSAQRFHTTTPWSKKHKAARLGAMPASVTSASFVTLPANKNHGIVDMKAVLLNQHWGLSEQMDDHSTIRKPAKSKYLWVPMSDRKKNTRPGKLIQAIKSGKQGSRMFIGKGKDGRVYIFKRTSKKRYPIQPMFLRRITQTIEPRIDFKRVVMRRAQRYMDYYFTKCMDQAIRTAKWT